jgi:hypothetical protein
MLRRVKSQKLTDVLKLLTASFIREMRKKSILKRQSISTRRKYYSSFLLVRNIFSSISFSISKNLDLCKSVIQAFCLFTLKNSYTTLWHYVRFSEHSRYGFHLFPRRRIAFGVIFSEQICFIHVRYKHVLYFETPFVFSSVKD